MESESENYRGHGKKILQRFFQQLFGTGFLALDGIDGYTQTVCNLLVAKIFKVTELEHLAAPVGQLFNL